ncbi:MAG: hypothetical protein AAGD38_10325 [Acidobacteriota bacterium]
MTYPGNASLPLNVRERIVNTFRQTLDLAAQGRVEEAMSGCEFVLDMDPLFHPATTLRERLQQGGQLRLDDIAVPQLESAPASPADAFDQGLPDLDELPDLDSLPDLDESPLAADLAPPAMAPPPAAAPVPPPAAPPAGDALGAVLQDLMAKRNYKQILQIARSQQQAIGADPSLQALVTKAKDALESDQFVQSFISRGRAALAAGDLDEARKLLSNARSLAADHPDVAVFASEIDAVAPIAPTEAALPDLDADESPMLGGIEVDDDLSFEPPAAEPVVPAAPAAPAEDSDEARIRQLLDEGQQAFDGGNYQGALDIWSRIFLIDIDNEEASRRVEEARNRKAELEREAEEIFHKGLDQVERNELDAARESFARVLQLQPGHTTAREYLEQLEAGEVPAIVRDRGDDDGDDLPDVPELIGDSERGTLEAAVERDRVVVVRKTDKKIVGLAAIAAIVVIGGIILLVSQWGKMFPNAEDSPVPAGPAVSQSALAVKKAVRMHESGDVEKAIDLLTEVPLEDPSYDEAQEYIATWRAELEASVEEAGLDPALIERRALLVVGTEQAMSSRQMIRARRYLDRAAQIDALDERERGLQAEIDVALRPLEKELDLFEQGEYETILPDLWRRLDSEADNPDVRLLMTDSYYSLVLRDLQRGNPQMAAEKLEDAVTIDADNRDFQRLLLFSQTYEKRPQDLLYRIFVKYLPPSR